MAFPAIRRLPLHMLGIGIVRIVALHAIVKFHRPPRLHRPAQPHMLILAFLRLPRLPLPVRTVVVGRRHAVMATAADRRQRTLLLFPRRRRSHQMANRARVQHLRRARKRRRNHYQGEEGKEVPHTSVIGRSPRILKGPSGPLRRNVWRPHIYLCVFGIVPTPKLLS